MLEVPIFWIRNIGDAQQLLNFFPTYVSDDGIAVLLVNNVIAGIALLFSKADLFTLLQLGNNAVDAEIFVSGFLAGATDNEWGARFVDQDGIYFIDDGVM